MKTRFVPVHIQAPQPSFQDPYDHKLLELFVPVPAKPPRSGALPDLITKLRCAWHAFRGVSADRPSHAIARHLAQRGYAIVRITPHLVRDGRHWYQDADFREIRRAFGFIDEHSPTHHVTLLWPDNARPQTLEEAADLACEHLNLTGRAL